MSGRIVDSLELGAQSIHQTRLLFEAWMKSKDELNEDTIKFPMNVIYSIY
jgi:hypothetical protein